MSNEKREVFSVKELAAYLGVSYNTANELTWREGFPVVTLGRRKLVPRQALEKWLMEQKRTY